MTAGEAGRGPALPGRAVRPPLRLRATPGGLPVGALLAGVTMTGALAVSLLHLDHLPITVCTFKRLTGLPCPSCGSTRALAALARLDLGAAFALNPGATLAALLLVAWAAVDLVLLVRRRALAVDVSPGLSSVLRVSLVVAVLANWAYLLAAGR